MNIKDLQTIIDILQNSDVTEFELEQDGTTIKLSRGTPEASFAAAPVQAAPQVVQHITSEQVAPVATQAAPEVDPNLTKVESPIVGTFYRRSSPDSDPFVDVGTAVKKGQTLCIVEAMKLMNEIEAPCDGVVEKILVNDSDVVEFGEALFLIK